MLIELHVDVGVHKEERPDPRLLVRYNAGTVAGRLAAQRLMWSAHGRCRYEQGALIGWHRSARVLKTGQNLTSRKVRMDGCNVW